MSAKTYTLKLQLNERGSWKTLLDFAPGQRKRVQADAVKLATLAGPGTRIGGVMYRITKDGRSAVAYLEAPYASWRNA